MDKKQIIESDGVHNEWYAEAKAMTMDKLPAFLDKLINDYNHDYGTICHALSAGAVATAYALDRSDAGGITGFQAGFVMWGFIKGWQKDHNKCGLRLVDYDDMLYPQYDHKFNKTISTSTWKAIQKEAAAHLNESGDRAHEAVVAHWQSIVDGVIPFGYSISDD